MQQNQPTQEEQDYSQIDPKVNSQDNKEEDLSARSDEDSDAEKEIDSSWKSHSKNQKNTPTVIEEGKTTTANDSFQNNAATKMNTKTDFSFQITKTDDVKQVTKESDREEDEYGNESDHSDTNKRNNAKQSDQKKKQCMVTPQKEKPIIHKQQMTQSDVEYHSYAGNAPGTYNISSNIPVVLPDTTEPSQPRSEKQSGSNQQRNYPQSRGRNINQYSNQQQQRQQHPSQYQANFTKNPQYSKTNSTKQQFVDSQITSDSAFQNQLVKMLIEKNSEMTQGYREMAKGAIEGMKRMGEIMVPLLELKEKENRKLKRLFSERYNLENDDDMLMEEIKVQSKRPNVKPKVYQNVNENMIQTIKKVKKGEIQQKSFIPPLREKVQDQQLSLNHTQQEDGSQQEYSQKYKQEEIESIEGFMMGKKKMVIDDVKMKQAQQLLSSKKKGFKGQETEESELDPSVNNSNQPPPLFQGTDKNNEEDNEVNKEDENDLSYEVSQQEDPIKPKKIDDDIMKALFNVSSQESMEDLETQDTMPEEQVQKINEYMENYQKIQELAQKQFIPVQDELESIYFEYAAKNMKVIEINYEDKIIKETLGDVVNPQIVMFQNADIKQELDRAKEMRYFPPEKSEETRIKIQNLQQAQVMKFNCFCKTREQAILIQHRNIPKIFINCQLCKNSRQFGIREAYDTLKYHLRKLITTLEFDENWVEHQYGQVTWKLSCYQHYFKLNCLNIPNLLYCLMVKAKREFIEAKKSFFQKVLQKDQSVRKHVILYVANIQKSKSRDFPNSYLLDLCDGQYIMRCFVSEKVDQFDCDRVLIEMIVSNQIKAGDKFHCYYLYLMKRPLTEIDSDPPVINTTHHYLQHKHNQHLKINNNGFTRAHNDAILGEQITAYFGKQLGCLNQFSKEIPFVDVFIVKKYAPYYVEEFEDEQHSSRKRMLLRSLKAVNKLRFIRKKKIEEKLAKEYDEQQRILERRNIIQSEQEIEKQQDLMKMQLQDQKRQKLDCFKMCFRVKAIDSLNFLWPSSSSDINSQRLTVISFVKASEEIYQEILEGIRYRFYNLKPDGLKTKVGRMRNSECLFLQFVRGKSSVENTIDMIKSKESVLSKTSRELVSNIQQYGKSVICKVLSPVQLLEDLASLAIAKDYKKLENYKPCNEMSFAAYIIKVIYHNPYNQPAGLEGVQKVILITSAMEIICLQMHDPNFFIKAGFPIDQAKVVCESIILESLTLVNMEDLSNTVIKDIEMPMYIMDYKNQLQEAADEETQFYFLNCKTNNNTQIEYQELRKKYQFQDQLSQVDQVIKTQHFKTKMKQIHLISGDKEQMAQITSSEGDFNSLRSNAMEFGGPRLDSSDLLVTQLGIINREQDSMKISTSNKPSAIKAFPFKPFKIEQKSSTVKQGFQGVKAGKSKLADSIAKSTQIMNTPETKFRRIDWNNNIQSDIDEEEVESEDIQSEDDQKQKKKRADEERVEGGFEIISDIEDNGVSKRVDTKEDDNEIEEVYDKLKIEALKHKKSFPDKRTRFSRK